MSQSKLLLPANEYRAQKLLRTGRRRKAAFAALLMILVVALLLIVLSRGSVTPFVLGTTWALIGLVGGWIGFFLKDFRSTLPLLHQEFLAKCNRLVQQASTPDQLLTQITQLLHAVLGADTLSIWRYDEDDSILILSNAEGQMIADDLTEVPVDLVVNRLRGVIPVTDLPESAFNRGLRAAGVQLISALNVSGQLVGVIGLGGAQLSGDTTDRLALLAGQLALTLHTILLQARLVDTQQKLQMAFRRTIDAQDDERRSLATELHDDILGRLTKMALSLHKSQQNLFDNPEAVADWLKNLETETQNINCRLREITKGLHPSVLTDLGLISAVQAYMDSLSRQPAEGERQTISFTAQGFGQGRLATQKLERDLYYITRQALDNALKHARAEQIFVHLRWDEQAVSVTIRDTGRGMSKPPEALMGQNGHLGLLSMYERALAWHGKLTFHTAPGQGTTIRARLPVDQPSAAPTHLQAFTQYLN